MTLFTISVSKVPSQTPPIKWKKTSFFFSDVYQDKNKEKLRDTQVGPWERGGENTALTPCCIGWRRGIEVCLVVSSTTAFGETHLKAEHRPFSAVTQDNAREASDPGGRGGTGSGTWWALVSEPHQTAKRGLA